MLIASVQEPAAARPLSHVDYFVGELTGNRFRARARGRLDAGDALYAPAVLVDERGRCLRGAGPPRTWRRPSRSGSRAPGR